VHSIYVGLQQRPPRERAVNFHHLIGLVGALFYYIYIERDVTYGASRNIKSPMFRICILNLKVQMTDPNR
jgi:hypothetical protein